MFFAPSRQLKILKKLKTIVEDHFCSSFLHVRENIKPKSIPDLLS